VCSGERSGVDHGVESGTIPKTKMIEHGSEVDALALELCSEVSDRRDTARKMPFLDCEPDLDLYHRPGTLIREESKTGEVQRVPGHKDKGVLGCAGLKWQGKP
jgi:hypothetical protein